MIVKKIWMEVRGSGPEWAREGWYLFGVIPLYIKDKSPRERRRR